MAFVTGQNQSAIIQSATNSGKTTAIIEIARAIAIRNCPVVVVLVLPSRSACEWHHANLTGFPEDQVSTTFGVNGARGLGPWMAHKSVLHITTPDGLVNNISAMKTRLAGHASLFVLDEADEYVLRNDFRPKLCQAIDIATQFAHRLLFTTATGSSQTMEALRGRASVAQLTPHMTKIGPQGLRARPDIEFRVVDLNGVSRNVQAARETHIVDQVNAALHNDPTRAVLVYIRDVYGPDKVTVAPKTTEFIARLRVQCNATVHMLVSATEEEARLEALDAVERAAETHAGPQRIVLVASDTINRVNAKNIGALIMSCAPAVGEDFLQLIGRVNRGAINGTRGLVVLLWRRQDAHTFGTRLHTGPQSATMSPVLKNAMIAMEDAVRGDKCFLNTIHQQQTGEAGPFTQETCPCGQCAINRAGCTAFPEMTASYKAILGAMQEAREGGAQFRSVEQIKHYLAGADDASDVHALMGSIGTEHAHNLGALKDVYGPASVERIVYAMRDVRFIAQQPSGSWIATDSGRAWLADPNAVAIVHPAHVKSLQSIKTTSIAPRGHAIEAVDGHDASARYENDLGATLDANLDVVHIACDAYGEKLTKLSFPPVLEPVLVPTKAHPLIVHTCIEMVEYHLKSQGKIEGTNAQEMINAVRQAHPDIGMPDEGVSITKFQCKGAKVCPAETSDDGMPCGTVLSRSCSAPCDAHRDTPLQKLKCSARFFLFAFAINGEMHELLITVSNHQHARWPAQNVPIGAEIALQNAVKANPELLSAAADFKSLVVEGLNGGDPIPLYDVAPRLQNPDVRRAIINKVRKTLPHGPTAMHEMIHQLETKHGQPYDRGFIKIGDGGVQGLATDHQIALIHDSDGGAVADQTYGVVSVQSDADKARKLTWYLWNVICLSNGKAHIVFRALMSGRTREHFAAALKLLSDAYAEHAAKIPGRSQRIWDVITSIHLDFEKAQFNAIKDAYVAAYGEEEGLRRFETALIACRVHHNRIGERHARRHGHEKLFLAIWRGIPALPAETKLDDVLVLLKTDGPIKREGLERIGLVSAAAIVGANDEIVVKWVGHSNWIDTLLANPTVLASVIQSKRDATTSVQGSTTNLGEAKHGSGATGQIKHHKSDKAKSLAEAARRMFQDDVQAGKTATAIADGIRMTNRSAGSDEKRKSGVMLRRIEQMSGEQGDADPKEPDSTPKSRRGTSTPACNCRVGDCTPQSCSCVINSRQCGAQCGCDPSKCQRRGDTTRQGIAREANDSPRAPSAEEQPRKKKRGDDATHCNCQLNQCNINRCNCFEKGRQCTNKCRCTAKCTNKHDSASQTARTVEKNQTDVHGDSVEVGTGQMDANPSASGDCNAQIDIPDQLEYYNVEHIDHMDCGDEINQPWLLSDAWLESDKMAADEGFWSFQTPGLMSFPPENGNEHAIDNAMSPIVPQCNPIHGGGSKGANWDKESIWSQSGLPQYGFNILSIGGDHMATPHASNSPFGTGTAVASEHGMDQGELQFVAHSTTTTSVFDTANTPLQPIPDQIATPRERGGNFVSLGDQRAGGASSRQVFSDSGPVSTMLEPVHGRSNESPVSVGQIAGRQGLPSAPSIQNGGGRMPAQISNAVRTDCAHQDAQPTPMNQGNVVTRSQCDSAQCKPRKGTGEKPMRQCTGGCDRWFHVHERCLGRTVDQAQRDGRREITCRECHDGVSRAKRLRTHISFDSDTGDE